MYLLCARIRLRFSALHFCNYLRKFHFRILFVVLNHPFGGVTFCRVTRRHSRLAAGSGARHQHVVVLSSASRLMTRQCGQFAPRVRGGHAASRDPMRDKPVSSGRRSGVRRRRVGVVGRGWLVGVSEDCAAQWRSCIHTPAFDKYRSITPLRRAGPRDADPLTAYRTTPALPSDGRENRPEQASHVGQHPTRSGQELAPRGAEAAQAASRQR